MMGKRIKAEIWDKMQYMFRSYYDRMIHCVFYYDNKIEVEKIKGAMSFIIEKNKVLVSSFINNSIRPYWKINDYNIDDIVKVEDIKKEELKNKIDEFILDEIPLKAKAQIRIKILNYENKSVLMYLINHMTMDGGGLSSMIECITKYYNDEDISKFFQIKERDYRLIYNNFSEEDEKVARNLYKNVSAKLKKQTPFFLNKRTKEDRRIIIEEIINSETLLKAKEKAKKELSASLNDLLLAAYFNAIYKTQNKTQYLAITSMVNLRRYIKDYEKILLSNHTGFMVTNLETQNENLKTTIEKVVKANKKNKNDKFLGIHSVPLINLAYMLFPHSISERLILIGYNNPPYSMSNVGQIKKVDLKLKNANCENLMLTGALKYKPYIQISCFNVDNNMHLTVAVKANEEEIKKVKTMLNYFKTSLDEYIKC